MRLLRGRKPTEAPKPHRGRIYRGREWWVYRCNDCDFGAGSTGLGLGVVPVYIDMATRHGRDSCNQRAKRSSGSGVSAGQSGADDGNRTR